MFIPKHEDSPTPRGHGTIRVSDTPLTVMGGSLEGVLEKLRKNAGSEALTRCS